MNIFILSCVAITLLCLYGLIRTLSVKNFFGAGFSLISLAVFGWFTVMSLIEAFTTT
ncbi:DUF2759 family protein [Caldalkalibacillus mannanilyticus]|uniref:DUF2759 family protein n=1 Tax=Caldalkalibacillus mannanilyticus TaxID=1418 RepID=UPI0009DD41CF|nr:DUF2759 family protein [Caldalkalibacillus mannanilyticus]